MAGYTAEAVHGSERASEGGEVNDRFNGDHVKGIEEYEDELRKKYADDSVEKSVDDNTVPSVPDNRANGFWDKRQAKEGLEAGSDRLHVGESG